MTDTLCENHAYTSIVGYDERQIDGSGMTPDVRWQTSEPEIEAWGARQALLAFAVA